LILTRAPLLENLFARTSTRARGIGRRFSPKLILFGVVALAVGGLGALAVMNARNESFARLSDSGEDSPFDRGEIVQHLWQMLSDFLPWGSGFGSFDTVFHIYEPRDALSTVYLNQAHNDWLQFVIEGGLPAAALLAVFSVWFLVQVFASWRSRRAQQAPARLGMLVVIALIAVASAVDYPLRVPIMMMILAIAISLMTDEEAALPPAETRS
jgi:O-antigen ligase